MSSPPVSTSHLGESFWRRWLRWLLGDWVDDVNRESLRVDLSAGLLGALLVLPQGIAFAALAGLPAQYGLYSAVLPGVVAALAGSSRHVMSGPTNANSLALASMLAPLAATGSAAYIELALAITVLVGLMQLAVGALRLGAVANFISPAALLGFTSGAAMLIAIYALRDGMEAGVPAGLGAIGTVMALARQASQAQWAAVLVALVACFGAVAVKRIWPRSPHMLIGLVAASLLGWGLQRSGAELTVTGELPAVLPAWHLPQVDWSHLPELLNKALALSVIALGQSLSIAKVLAARSGQRLDVNREFTGQGLSNVVGGLFSCYLSCGSLNRSLPNLQAGARTPLAAVSSSLWLLLLVAVLAAPLAHIPRAAIAGLLLLVAWGLIDTEQWRHVVRSDRSEYAVALTTFVATLTLRLESAILLGTSLALLLYLYRSARPAMRLMGFRRGDPARHFVVLADDPDPLPPCPQLQLLRMEGSIYFGASAHVGDYLHGLRQSPDAARHLLVMSKSMNSIDLAGLEVWEQELRERRARGGDLYFHRPRPQVMELWRRSGFLQRLGPDHIFPGKRQALGEIHRRLDPQICATCQVRLFRECAPDDPAAAI